MDYEKIRNTLCYLIYINDSLRAPLCGGKGPQAGEVTGLSL